MLPPKTKHRSRTSIPPLIFIGAVLILAAVFAIVTLKNIQRHRENSTRMLLEKGAALIRSFEAGTRAGMGMMGRGWGGQRLQQLLEETARQPDIAYLTVTDDQGRTLAHSDSAQIARIHGREVDFKEIAASPELKWAWTTASDGKQLFEVYRRFAPKGMFGGPRHGRMMHRRRGHFNGPFAENGASISRAIFVGLHTQSVEESGKAVVLNIVVTGTILFLAGSAGIILLFLFQNYRSAKTSLFRIKAFSDNLVENMPIGLLELDARKKLTSMNGTAESLLDLVYDRTAGQDAAHVLPAELVSRLEEVGPQKEMVEGEIECALDSGKTIPLEVSTSTLKNEQGELSGYILLFKDLTEVRTLRKEIARSQRLASLGSLAAGVAHEIRNPLSSIKGFATYFKERYHDVPQDLKTADIMIREVERLNRVVGQLLELSRPVEISSLSTDIGSLLQESLKLVEQQASEKNIAVRTVFPKETVEMDIDRDKIKQVLLNLYLNAMDAMETGGRLSVELSRSEEGKSARIKITDSGAGIPKQDLSRIFDPYFTTKTTGTGLGLAVVHNIVEAHHGQIKAESRLGEGSIFTLILSDFNVEKTDEE
ncbi:MAG: PAS domain-containing protein [Proteobacteria bacterium]|nr:PAS domain-containing protein [Pseudomonadota bacterium]